MLKEKYGWQVFILDCDDKTVKNEDPLVSFIFPLLIPEGFYGIGCGSLRGLNPDSKLGYK